MTLYENDYYIVNTVNGYEKVPGMCEIIEKNIEWYRNEDTINSLALLEHTIRSKLLELGAELTGIYREEKDDFKVIIIPYFVDKLEENDISPDLYQPYINKYLDSFKDDYRPGFNEELKNLLEKELN